jgi:ADP-ribose pyrophosphatase YjhB (NUDIX family)
MNFSQRIYYNDKPLILTTDKEAYINDHPDAGSYLFFSGATLRSFNQAQTQLDKPGSKGVIIEDDSEESIKEQLGILFTPIHAAGGVVYNETGEVLMIFRRGKWDLPKGKLDEGENIEECALREVKEETGLQKLALNEKLLDTYHIYFQNNDQLLKCTAWYKMAGSSNDTLKPQKEENILEARWVNEKDLPPLAARTYEAIREVLHVAGLKW